MAVSPAYQSAFDPAHPIDRDELIVPELLVDDPAAPAAQILKPALDAVWASRRMARLAQLRRRGQLAAAVSPATASMGAAVFGDGAIWNRRRASIVAGQGRSFSMRAATGRSHSA
jgi:hypothetical protein